MLILVSLDAFVDLASFAGASFVGPGRHADRGLVVFLLVAVATDSAIRAVDSVVRVAGASSVGPDRREDLGLVVFLVVVVATDSVDRAAGAMTFGGWLSPAFSSQRTLESHWMDLVRLRR